MVLGLGTGLALGYFVFHHPVRDQREVLLLDIVDMQPQIDDQYERVLEDVTDISRYHELRDRIDECFSMVNDYNDIRGDRWPYMPAEYCDRIFP